MKSNNNFRRGGRSGRGSFQENRGEPRKFYQLNIRIESESLRVIDSDGTSLGVMSKTDALEKARIEGLDLVLVVPKAMPPVAKIIEFSKFLYQEEKKQKESKKGSKKSIVKDVKISLFIAEADLQRLVDKTKEFISEGNQVRLNLSLKGREIMKKDMAIEVVKKMIILVGEVTVSREPHVEGRVIRAVLSKKK